jgi:hypothetical protein
MSFFLRLVLLLTAGLLAAPLLRAAAPPPRDSHLPRVEARLKGKPNDPAALLARAQRRGEQLNFSGAIADLDRILATQPPRSSWKVRARGALFHILSDYLERDFAAAEKHLARHRALCDLDPGLRQQRPRLAEHLSLLARGRTAQSNYLAALEALWELVGIEMPGLMVTAKDDRKRELSSDVWARQHLAGLLARATIKQRKAIDRVLLEKWRGARSKTDEKAMRSLIALVPVDQRLGREVRLHLAGLLAVRGYASGADQLLQEVRGGPDAGDAAKALLEEARMLARAELMPDTVACYQLLGQKHGKTEVEPGRTGAEVLQDLLTDKRFLPYLDQRLIYAGPYRLDVKASKEGPPTLPHYTFPLAGETPPFFRRHRLTLDEHDAFHVQESGSGDERFRVGLPHADFLRIVRNPEHDPRVSYPAQTLGHVVVLNLGAWVLGIDPLSRKLLWQHDAMSPGKGPTNVREVVCMSDRTARVHYRVGGELRLGAPLPLTATRLCMATKNGLVALDPVTGARRWVREDVPANCRLFHDGENLFVVRFDTDGKVTATAAYRLLDGAPVAVKDFTALYSRRTRSVDGKLLLSEVDARKVLTMRLHDVAAGKEVWRQTFPAGSLPLLAEDPALTGAVEPGGGFHILEARTIKAVMLGKLEKEHLAGAKAIRLLSDPEYFYVAIEGPPDKNVVDKPQSLFLAGAGLRAVPVNGQLYAFQRATGKLCWHNPVPNQTLLVSQIERVPVLLLAARRQQLVGKPPRTELRVVIRAIHKYNGKLMHENQWLSPNDAISWVGGSDDGSTATVTGSIGTLRFTMRKGGGP